MTKLGITKLLIVTASIAALTAGAAFAQGKGKGSGPSGSAPPTWSGSNPPGFGVDAPRTGWDNGKPPGWDNSKSNRDWDGGNVPPGLAKKGKK